MNWYLEVLKNYAGFSGRASRSEYWFFTLVNTIIMVVLQVLTNIMVGVNSNIGAGLFGIISLIYALAVLLPSLAVCVRRLHDTSRSGWWLLIGLVPVIGFIVLLVFLVSDSIPQKNQFGASPKQLTA